MYRKALSMILALLLFAFACAQAEPEGGNCIPEEFVFTGGTGRVTITCPQFTLADGQAYAKLIFSSQNYTNIRIGEENFSPEYTDEGAVFTIPAPLNRAFSIWATTVAMSSPHEIEYRVYIGYGSTHPAGLYYSGSMVLNYAEGFRVDYYEGGYALIRVGKTESYLAVPEGKPVPDGLKPSVVVLQKPIDRIYLAATSAMSLFDAMGALDRVRLSGTQRDGWYVEGAVQAMDRGDILYAGKYSAPDYELLIRENCDLAVESMMILHTPRAREMIELLGIPVFIDRSSSEAHPLGRLEWIRLYGLLTDREAEAEAVFEKQTAKTEAIGAADSEKTVAFFSIKSNGSVTVRGSEDYIVRSIELAGGQYVFDSIRGQETNASVNITMEAFFMNAMDADYLIYNSAIGSPVRSIRELVSMQPLLGEFWAVETGNVFCTQPSLYQSTDGIGTFIEDLVKMLSGQTEGMEYLYKLE